LSVEEEKASVESTSAVRVGVVSAINVDVDHRHPELQKQIDELKSTTERLILEINNVRGLVEVSPVRVRVIETREVSIEEAKKMIAEYMETHDTAYPDDIADDLGLDLKVAVESVRQLVEEGKVMEREE
jgi:hypothetical protein